MNNLSSYCVLVLAKIRVSDKDLSVQFFINLKVSIILKIFINLKLFINLKAKHEPYRLTGGGESESCLDLLSLGTISSDSSSSASLSGSLLMSSSALRNAFLKPPVVNLVLSLRNRI